MKHLKRIVRVGIIASALLASPTIASAIPTNVIATNQGQQKQTEDINYRHFDINADMDGYYYIEFWLIPARHADKTFTQYSVEVNGETVGQITPPKG